jgi:dynein heavy chain, axonemal
MNYQTMGDIFKGLAQTGAWGCFDEFNRINIEVLSVVATQVKAILDAAVLYSIPANREEKYQSAPAGSPPAIVGMFEFMGDIINLIPTCGFFITMNPGYAGRTELPENLKALFRSCAMIRPDLALICENMLMSEGFNNARPLSIKFVSLYELSSALLSPQPHYDWGLRSIKSVLRVAGGLKRAEPDIHEDGILMRALRDFNTPKMPNSDLPIFLRLIQDLFPKYYQLPTKLKVSVQRNAIQACKEAKPQLQSDPVFVAKVVQLQELMDVRHSVMLLGPGGCGKTTIWKTLAASHNLGLTPKTKWTCIYDVVDPKAVTSDELYGYMTLSKEWRDGCLSIIMRGMSKNTKELGYAPQQSYKWAVLDGDIDAVWIESMNTVMDDNKMLTLVSNERIPLSPAMRMVFEINSLANATPATVSRAGILFINESDIGWRPFVDTWMQSVQEDTYKAHLPGLFDKFVEPIVEGARKMKNVVPIQLITQVVSVCRLLETFLEQVPKEPRRTIPEILEHMFFVAVTWSFGGALIVEVTEDGGTRGNHRRNFSEMLMQLATTIKLPKDSGDDATCFDFFFNPVTEELEHWSTRVPKYVPVPIGNRSGEQPFSALVVPTVDTTRLTALLDQLVKKGHPVMFVGTAGTGKTTLVKTYLSTLQDPILSSTVTMNYYMDSAALQARIDATIDKRSGRIFGPPNGKKLIFYIDDLNLPYIETVSGLSFVFWGRRAAPHLWRCRAPRSRFSPLPPSPSHPFPFPPTLSPLARSTAPRTRSPSSARSSTTGSTTTAPTSASARRSSTCSSSAR